MLELSGQVKNLLRRNIVIAAGGVRSTLVSGGGYYLERNRQAG